jgi:Mrp family chromosome partitioning ATPase
LGKLRGVAAWSFTHWPESWPGSQHTVAFGDYGAFRAAVRSAIVRVDARLAPADLSAVRVNFAWKRGRKGSRLKPQIKGNLLTTAQKPTSNPASLGMAHLGPDHCGGQRQGTEARQEHCRFQSCIGIGGSEGAAVRLVDVFHGPSVPGMLGIERLEKKLRQCHLRTQVIPAQAHGIKVMSMGMLMTINLPFARPNGNEIPVCSSSKWIEATT